MDSEKTAAAPAQARPINDVTPLSASLGVMTPNLVKNIPLHNPDHPAAGHHDDDPELDKMMHEVGQEVNKIEKRPKKHGFAWFGKGSKKEAPFKAQPIANAPASPPIPMRPDIQSKAPVPAVPPPQAANNPKPQTQKTPAPAKKKSNTPVMAITFAVIITGALIAAAFYTFSNS